MTTRWNTIEAQPRDACGRVKPAPRQHALLRAIDRLTRKHGYPPTVRELEAAMGYSTTNAVAQQLALLRRKGWVTWQPGRARTLRVVGE